MPYRNILNIQMDEYNKIYKRIRKEYPSYSLDKKHNLTLVEMLGNRGLKSTDIYKAAMAPYTKEFAYTFEVVAVNYDIDYGIDRYYLKDDSLFEFFKNTEVRPKEVKSILETLDDTENGEFWGVIGKEYSFTMVYSRVPNDNRHFLTIFTDEMNYTCCIDDYNGDDKRWIFNMAINFLFYINAFPECVIDGVPAGVKRNPKAKSIGVSEKIISHKTVEHGFVRAHFRSGYFRHLNSDYFVNCKGQVRFIQSTMVKGRAKTVLPKEEN